MLDAEEHAVEVDRLLALPVGERHLDDAGTDADAGVVDQDVEPLVLPHQCVDDCDPLVFRSDVVVQEVGGAPAALDLGDDVLAGTVLDVGDDDLCPSPASRMAHAHPMPDAPPVTIATLPATRSAMTSS